MEKGWTSQLVLAFFGLTSEDVPEFRLNLFKQIHEIVFYGKGGYTWETVYSMPRWLRLFTTKEIMDHYKKEQEAIKNATSQESTTLVGTDGKINPKSFPTFTQSKYK